MSPSKCIKDLDLVIGTTDKFAIILPREPMKYWLIRMATPLSVSASTMLQDETGQDVGDDGGTDDSHGGADQLTLRDKLLSSAWVLREAGADPGVVNKNGWTRTALHLLKY